MIGAFSQSRDFRFDTLTATSGQPDNRTFHSVLSPSWQLSKNITLQRWDYFWVELIPPASRSDNVEQQVLRFCNSLAYVLHVFEVARLSKVFLLKWLAPPPSEYQVACAITTLTCWFRAGHRLNSFAIIPESRSILVLIRTSRSTLQS